MKTILNNKGQGVLVVALVIALAAGVGVVSLVNKGDIMVFEAKGEKKELLARQDFNRLFALGSYLVANNFVLCKRSAWQIDVDPMGCIYSADVVDSKNNIVREVPPSDFGLNLINRTKSSDLLTFEVDMEKFKEGRSVDTQQVTSKAIITFQLVDTYNNEVYEQLAGKLSDEEREVNLDHYMILQTVTLTLDALGKKEDTKQVVRKIGIRRPIAIPRLITQGSQCAAQCQPSRGENTQVACRGKMVIDENSKSEIKISIENLGPGVIYDLVYKKDVTYSTTGEKDFGGQMRAIKDRDFLTPDDSVNVVDTVKCQRFVQTSNNPADNGKIELHSRNAGNVKYNINITDAGSNKGQKDYIDKKEVYHNPVKYLFDGIFPEAYADGFDSCAGKAAELLECKNGSLMEPFRGVVSEAKGEFQGYTETIYVAPPH